MDIKTTKEIANLFYKKTYKIKGKEMCLLNKFAVQLKLKKTNYLAFFLLFENR